MRRPIVLHDSASGKPVGLDAQHVVSYTRRGERTIVRLEVEVRETPKEIAKIIKDA